MLQTNISFIEYWRSSVEFSRSHSGADDTAKAGKYAWHSVKIMNSTRVVYTKTRRQKWLQLNKHLQVINLNFTDHIHT